MRESTKYHFRQVAALPEPTPDAKPAGKVRVIVLASGSKGNAILIAYGQHALLVDAGITPEEAARRSRSVGYPLTKLDAVLLTHWHRDHCKNVGNFCKDFHCPLICSKATLMGLETQPAHRRAAPGEALEIGSEWEIHSLKIDHEEGSLAFHVRVGGKNIVVAHDLAQVNSTILAAARAADCLCIEANYSPERVTNCTDPNHVAELHARILSVDRGHLSNPQAGEVVRCVDPARIQAVCALHLSSSHNTEEEAEEEIRMALPPGAHPTVYVARQDSAVLIEVNGGPSPLELSLLDQFRKLDRQVDAIIGEQKRADSETADRRVVMGEYLAQMRGIFESRDPGTKLDGFEFFDNWKEAKAKAYGVSKRTMDYYLLDAETVVPLIGRDVARSLPLGTISELGKLAKAKGRISAETLQYAQEHLAHEVRAHVASILYPGKTGHFDGPEDHITITAGKAQIETLRKKLDVARPFVAPEASDAEVLEFALEEFIQAHQHEQAATIAVFAAHDEDMQPLVQPVPPPPDFDDIAQLMGEKED